jgi:uncharacterized damage-inducible protein DinB
MEASMTRCYSSLAVLALTVVASTSAHAQARAGGPPPCTTLSCDVTSDWARTARQITQIADAMPEDKWAFKATPAQRSYGEQVMHIVTTDVSFMGALGGKTPAPMINTKATSKADVMAALKQSFAYGEAVLKEFSDAQLQERVPGMFMGPTASRLRLIYFDMGHSQDIYGQMAVYLRLNGIVPPASNRP